MTPLRSGLITLLTPLLLAGCASPYPESSTYPESAVIRIEEPAGSARSEAEPVQSGTQLARISERPAAIGSLLGTARQQRASGNNEAALATLERALRIAPRDGELYYELALTHRALRQPAQARQLAQRGLSLAREPGTRQALKALLAEL